MTNSINRKQIESLLPHREPMLLIDKLINTLIEKKLDYASNTIKPTYPDGLDAEVFTFKALQEAQKKAKSKEKKSYTKTLLKSGKNKIAQKVSEESSELIIDYLNGSKKRTIEEASDLIYHLFVLLHSKNIKLEDIKKELKSRRNVRRK